MAADLVGGMVGGIVGGVAVDAPRGMAPPLMIGRPSDPMSCFELLRALLVDVVDGSMFGGMVVDATRGLGPPLMIGRPSDPICLEPRRMDIMY